MNRNTFCRNLNLNILNWTLDEMFDFLEMAPGTQQIFADRVGASSGEVRREVCDLLRLLFNQPSNIRVVTLGIRGAYNVLDKTLLKDVVDDLTLHLNTMSLALKGPPDQTFPKLDTQTGQDVNRSVLGIQQQLVSDKTEQKVNKMKMEKEMLTDIVKTQNETLKNMDKKIKNEKKDSEETKKEVKTEIPEVKLQHPRGVDELLMRFGLYVESVRGNGKCLFQSMALSVNKPVDLVRQHILAFIQYNPDEIVAAVACYDKPIIVMQPDCTFYLYSPNSPMEVHQNPNILAKTQGAVLLYYNGATHYDAIIAKND
jgi:hypothetical protein